MIEPVVIESLKSLIKTPIVKHIAEMTIRALSALFVNKKTLFMLIIIITVRKLARRTTIIPILNISFLSPMMSQINNGIKTITDKIANQFEFFGVL